MPVIPGRREAENPESRKPATVEPPFWIPGSR
jgi:hypothetical protein